MNIIFMCSTFLHWILSDVTHVYYPGFKRNFWNEKNIRFSSIHLFYVHLHSYFLW